MWWILIKQCEVIEYICIEWCKHFHDFLSYNVKVRKNILINSTFTWGYFLAHFVTRTINIFFWIGSWFAVIFYGLQKKTRFHFEISFFFQTNKEQKWCNSQTSEFVIKLFTERNSYTLSNNKLLSWVGIWLTTLHRILKVNHVSHSWVTSRYIFDNNSILYNESWKQFKLLASDFILDKTLCCIW